MSMSVRIMLLLIPGILMFGQAGAELTEEQLEQWFQNDTQAHPADRKSDDGKPVFLTVPPTKPVPHSTNVLTVTKESLATGWVQVAQCHENLDPVAAVQVIYRYKQIRGLKITKTANIGKAWVEEQTIQMEDVKHCATLCAYTEARVFYRDKQGGYFIVNGPFQRRFLDSFFPMRLSMTIRYPDKLLYISKIHPDQEPGFMVTRRAGEVHIDTWFEGKLVLGVEFKLADK